MSENPSAQDGRVTQFTEAAGSIIAQAKMVAEVHQHPGPSRLGLLYKIAQTREGAERLQRAGYDPVAIAAACFASLGDHRRSASNMESWDRCLDKAAEAARQRPDPGHWSVGVSDLCDALLAEAKTDQSLAQAIEGAVPFSAAELLLWKRLELVDSNVRRSDEKTVKGINEISDKLTGIQDRAGHIRIALFSALALGASTALLLVGLGEDRLSILAWFKQLFV